MVCHELKGFARRDSVQQAVEDVIQGRLRQVAEIMRSQNKAKTAFKPERRLCHLIDGD